MGVVYGCPLPDSLRGLEESWPAVLMDMLLYPELAFGGRNRSTCFNDIESKSAVRGRRWGRCAVALDTSHLSSN